MSSNTNKLSIANSMARVMRSILFSFFFCAHEYCDMNSNPGTTPAAKRCDPLGIKSLTYKEKKNKLAICEWFISTSTVQTISILSASIFSSSQQPVNHMQHWRTYWLSTFKRRLGIISCSDRQCDASWSRNVACFPCPKSAVYDTTFCTNS